MDNHASPQIWCRWKWVKGLYNQTFQNGIKTSLPPSYVWRWRFKVRQTYMQGFMKEITHNCKEDNQWGNVNRYWSHAKSYIKLTIWYLYLWRQWALQQWLWILTKHQSTLSKTMDVFPPMPFQGVTPLPLISGEVASMK